jgi:hypothetical protein
MALKVVLFYTQGQRGWTETYYAAGSTPQTYSQLYCTASNLQMFVDVRANDVTLVESRVSLIGSPRVVYATPFNLQSDVVGGTDQDDYVQDTYGEDVLLLVRAGPTIPRHIWLRGMPNIYITYFQDGTPNPPPELLYKITRLQASIVAMQLQIQNAVIPTPNSGLWFPVSYVTAGPTPALGASAVYVGTAPSISPPFPPLYFQGINRNQLPGFPRILTPISIGTGSPVLPVYVPYLYRGNQTETPGGKMKFAVLSYSYSLITNVLFSTYGTRKTGRPSGLPRGRAPAVVKRQ